MKTGMKCLILLCIGAALCYGIYSYDQVNRENDRLKVTTFSDRKPQTINGTEYTVLKNTICDYSKIKEQYPVIEPMLDVDGDVAKGKPGRLKVLLVKMRIKNSSEHTQYLNLADIVIKSPAYSNALSTEMFCEINHIESCMLAIAPGVEVPVTLPYELYEISFSDAHFRDLQKLPFSIVLTSYPDIREISLSNITYKAGTSSKSAQKQQKAKKKDTPEGSILDMDQECIYEEVGYRIEEFVYTTNVKRYKEYKRKGLYDPELVDSKGNVQPNDSELKGGAGTCYMMFIKCRIKNYSDTAKRIRASVPATGNYMKDGRYVYEGDNTYFTCSKKIEFDPDVIQLNPGEEVTCVTGKLTYCHKKYWDIDKTDFYVRLCGRGDGISDPDKLDPRAGVLGKAVNILVKSSQIKKK